MKSLFHRDMPQTLLKLPVLQSGGRRHPRAAPHQPVLRDHETLGTEEETRMPEGTRRDPPRDPGNPQNLFHHPAANHTEFEYKVIG